LYQNKLTGTIPPKLSQLPNLEGLYAQMFVLYIYAFSRNLHENQLSGVVPSIPFIANGINWYFICPQNHTGMNCI
jgi:hypothetical protein